ncbi:formimidoylglutamate deiminase [Phytohabitans aurantiacus]|uniref:Formimidoylglutamate deiminase n=1 Tax=Phytohabitans aurantiacus TaxID=3016789 RepID=A0ABQ5QQ82_9ACTN|nr:formimidoylglutamate deiminase [Phytohabitans aurantiacus]GLH95766.1 formimidoylglutamate deiminase [Phytohabitans aurantiacus]
MTTYHAEYAWVDGSPARDVLIDVDGGRITTVTANAEPRGTPLRGLTLPGLANGHSHAFHRALRGRANVRGTFWHWRERMYDLAARLTPDTYRDLARATYAEMALAGITCVGEFHYLHHGPGGTPYADPNEMSAVLVEAAAEAGIRITLLDACYLSSTVDGQPLSGVQERFGDGDAERWAARVDALKPPPHALVGAAIHSVRAVPAAQIPTVAARGGPLHVHLSEQRAENAACQAYHHRTPTELLADAGVLGPRTTAVHATHLTDGDRTELGDTNTGVCLCPTTERDLADGIGPARALADAGSPLSLGSDSHAIIDILEEARAMEMDERLHTERRGHFTTAELVAAATAHTALGWQDAGALLPGHRADLVTITLDSPRTAGTGPDGVLFAATAADVTGVVVDGREVVRDGRHLTIDVPAALRHAIKAVT